MGSKTTGEARQGADAIQEATDHATIIAKIRETLSQSPYYAVRRLTCDVRDGVPVLRGRVPTYFLKQVAQSEVLKAVDGCLRVENRLEVL